MAFLKSMRTGFSRTFWVANVIELFERFAFYGSKAVLAVYLAEQVGLGPEGRDWLVGNRSSTRCSTSCPSLAGTIVDRYGFKQQPAGLLRDLRARLLPDRPRGLPAGQPLVQAAGRRRPTMMLALVVTADRRLADQAVASSARSRAPPPRRPSRSATRSTTRS